MRKFIRTRPASPPAQPPAALHATHEASPLKTNGHANGGAAAGAGCGGEDAAADVSTLSRAWSGWEVEGECGECGECGEAPWEDTEFPASWRVLGARRPLCGLAWVRPTEVCARPEFRAEGDGDGARWTVIPGALGGAHVCVAASALAHAPRLLDRAAPPQQGAARAARYRFRFWEAGAWRDVWVDDRLPMRAARARPLCSRAAHARDFTLPLLEKAYAKWRGGWRALRRDGVGDALRALTGGVVQSFQLRRALPAHVLRALEAAVPRATLAVAWRGAHAVTVAGTARVRTVPLLRVRGAPGTAAAVPSATWRALSPSDRELLAARSDPGDCWLSLAELMRSFSGLELVHVPPEEWVLEPALRARRPWRAVVARRRWRAGCSAGGGPRAATHLHNPQFHVQVRAGGECHAVVSVLQRGARHALGFSVYCVPLHAPLGAVEFRALRPLHAPHVARAPEVSAHFALAPGRYLVVPHTRRAHTDAAFLLRILTDEPADVWEVNEDNCILSGGALEPTEDEERLPAGVVASLQHAARQSDGALDAVRLRAALRSVWRACLEARPSAALCRALLPLGDAALAGALCVGALPALVCQLAAWRAAWRAAGGGARRCSYRLRTLLAASGARVSNKVLDALTERFARGAPARRVLRHEDYVIALARLHLAHARHSALDARHKTSPVPLEEMILMTIYT